MLVYKIFNHSTGKFLEKRLIKESKEGYTWTKLSLLRTRLRNFCHQYNWQSNKSMNDFDLIPISWEIFSYELETRDRVAAGIFARTQGRDYIFEK